MGATHNVCQLDTMACNKLQKTVALLPIERKKTWCEFQPNSFEKFRDSRFDALSFFRM